MKKKINEICKDLEKQHKIKILFAIESGSRLWRIDSIDSDYDIRFVFVRPIEDYLRIDKLKEVIGYEENNIEFVGFDIYKFSKLLRASNSNTIEWLLSDIIYYGKKPKEFLNFIAKNFNPTAMFHHYLSMCRQNYLKYIKSGNKVTYKKYLYAMRGLLNAIYIKKIKKIPPINFNLALQKKNIIPENIRKCLLRIIELKKIGKEEEIIENSKSFDSFIEKQLKMLKAPKSIKINQSNILMNEVLKIVKKNNIKRLI